MDDVPDWAEWLRHQRAAAGLSADALGAKAGVSGETIRRLERGYEPAASTKRKIEDALARPSDTERINRLEDDLAALRRDVQVLLGFAARLLEQRPADREDDPDDRPPKPPR